MKRIYILLNLILLSSCSHFFSNSDKVLKNDFPLSFDKSKWMDREDYVRYVNFYSRTPSNSGSTYNLIGDCDGFPKIDIKTPPGFCVGQLYSGEGLRKPRTAAVLSRSEVIITDMGSWNPYDGKILILSFENGRSEIKELFTSKTFPDLNDPRREIINRPHQITKHSDGKFYIGASKAFLRFDPLSLNPKESIEVLINNLPAEGLHPLKSFAFDDNLSLYINIGAATNVCHKNSLGGIFGNRKKSCDEAEDFEIGQGQIRKYKINEKGLIDPKFEIFSKGLRNSVALVWDHKNNVLIQGENSRDAIEKMSSNLSGASLPHDEINLLTKGGHYGWPYCYDNNQNSPEWKNSDCSIYKKPYLFLPAHSAPLSFIYYTGSMFPEWYKGKMLASFHGYEPKGHRIVSFNQNELGLPIGIPQSLVFGWDAKAEQKVGSPVGLTQLQDGSVLIVEDSSQKILRLFYDFKNGDGLPIQEIDKTSSDSNSESNRSSDEQKRKLALEKKLASANPLPFTLFQSKIIDKSCVQCHGGANAPGIQLLRYDDEGNEKRILASKKEVELFSMVKADQGYPPMPPQGFETKDEAKEAVRLLELWMSNKPN